MSKDSFDVGRILKDFNAKTEEELMETVNNTWYVAECTNCGKELDLRVCEYDDGDPICLGGCHGYK